MTVLDDSDWSHKAWMSKRDADLFEAIVQDRAKRARLRVLEWGAGRSTHYFTRMLAELGTDFHWLSLEYDREFFDRDVLPQMGAMPNARATHVERGGPHPAPAAFLRAEKQAVDFVVYDYGKLQPFLADHAADRAVVMDDYVSFPSTLQRQFDVILVDGRKRRRCLLEGAKLVAPDGVVVIHDAQRTYYHCAFEAFRANQPAGDILWICAQMDTNALERLVSHAEAK